MNKKPRDKLGRFVKIPGTKRYNVNDIDAAFFAGLNAAYGVILPPARRLALYKSQKEII